MLFTNWSSSSAIDPVLQKSQDDRILTSLQRLPDLETNVLEDHELDDCSQQCRKYVLDQTIPIVKGGERIDAWWSKFVSKPGYESLAKMNKAVLSCFHGPQVENSFSAIKNILNCKTSRMNVPTFDAKQSIRYDLASSGKLSVEYFHREYIVFSPVNKQLMANMKTGRSRYTEEIRIAKEKEQAKRETQIETKKTK